MIKSRGRPRASDVPQVRKYFPGNNSIRSGLSRKRHKLKPPTTCRATCIRRGKYFPGNNRIRSGLSRQRHASGAELHLQEIREPQAVWSTATMKSREADHAPSDAPQEQNCICRKYEKLKRCGAQRHRLSREADHAPSDTPQEQNCICRKYEKLKRCGAKRQNKKTRWWGRPGPSN